MNNFRPLNILKTVDNKLFKILQQMKRFKTTYKKICIRNLLNQRLKFFVLTSDIASFQIFLVRVYSLPKTNQNTNVISQGRGILNGTSYRLAEVIKTTAIDAFSKHVLRKTFRQNVALQERQTTSQKSVHKKYL